MATQTKSKNIQLPQTFSEPFTCLVCGLVHNQRGFGPDAFRLSDPGDVEAAIEIKATTTAQGFTDIKREMKFDELYWLSFEQYDLMQYKIYKINKTDLKGFVDASRTARDRATMNLRRVVDDYSLNPIHQGYIGIVCQ